MPEGISTHVMPDAPFSGFPTFPRFNPPRERQPGEHTSEINDGSPLKLRLLLSDSKVEEDHHYALVSMPTTYEEAQSAAALVFGSYMESSPRNVDETKITLRCSIKNREGKWCWANIRPKDWKLMMKTSATEEVGVFYTTRKPSKRPIAMSDFTVGKVGLIVGEHKATGIDWKTDSSYPKSNTEITDTMVDRPSSYEEAVITITGADSDHGIPSYSYLKKAVQNIGNKRLKFYYFTSTADGLPVPVWWKEFPEEAYHDKDVWRKIVPEAGQLLGFTIEKDSNVDPEKGKES